MVARGWGEEGDMGVFQLVKVSVMQNELVLEICMQLEPIVNIPYYTFKFKRVILHNLTNKQNKRDIRKLLELLSISVA